MKMVTTHSKIDISKLITVDKTGAVKVPTNIQLLDKDLLMLYNRDISPNKTKFLKWLGVIYYLGDPNSPTGQQGLTKAEALAYAVDNFDLEKDFVIDPLLDKLINKYYRQNITEAGVALDTLRKSIHLITLAGNRINEILGRILSDDIDIEVIDKYLELADGVSKRVKEIPNLTKALETAYENLRNERESELARGGKEILSSMSADEGQW